MSPTRMRWRALTGRVSGYHLARHGRSVEASPVHTHDFAEVFRVDSGGATHLLGGRGDRVAAGDVVLVAPDDAHRFLHASPDFTMTNLALSGAALERIRDRYFDGGPSPWDAAPPRRFRVAAPQDRPDRGFAPPGGRQRLQIDRFLIEVLDAAAGAPTGPVTPRWLGEAIAAWRRDPVAMGRGVTGLAEIAGRSRGHLGRVIQRSTGRTAVDVVNSIRMEEAASRLRRTDLPIPVVAAEVGILSLSHFYRVFQDRIGTTPARYRRS